MDKELESQSEKALQLSLILVNYNDRSHLERCLSSVAANIQGIPFEVLFVDNNSSDGSQDFVRQKFPWVKLIANPVNVGYSRANNQAVKASRGRFILFLNTDTEVYPETVPMLLGELEADPLLAGVGPALIQGRGRYQISFGGKVNFCAEFFQKFFLNFYRKLVRRFVRRKRRVRWLSGAFLLLRQSVLEEVGLFDEHFFLFFEDIDLCFRIRKKGYRLLYLARVKAFHEGGATTSAANLSSRLEYRRSQLYFYQKHTSASSRFLLRFFLRLNAAFGMLFSRRSKEQRAFYRSQISALLARPQAGAEDQR